MALIYCSGLAANPATVDAARYLASAGGMDPEWVEWFEKLQHQVNRRAANSILRGLLKAPTNDA
ncbi:MULTISPECIES: hypothetical protein [unclassified Novosphingobium]|uniref:hypothetical protein n=1 Tax=unclassified Novosphingobium TaxID=2644732 RepID=UPI000D3119A9|nr:MULTISPECIES: hypothetical protein [unclassified Novosphingobium]PTR07912.1 hypothetical protein C8K11_113124 [Novosphingobium sp. GV055]PUB00725.1 hypothetical protein C8K12_113124 [Novosphingobium sp. GV061]PUB16134.1 hypothetical protein C8K14_113124 [Novosphingobium sp. GV079]PUB39599.1 hypothetical protein C8K10_113124 [Novosphingobium sp. GV027]